MNTRYSPLTFTLGLLLAGHATVSAVETPELRLNNLEYLEMPGLNVMLAHDFYPEGHQGGVGIIQNGLRVATNGDIRLEPTPGQWQPVPKVGEREVDVDREEISVRMSYPDEAKNRKGFNPVVYPDLEFAYRIRVFPEGRAFRIVVDLEEALPEEWIGRVGFNMELFPGILFGKAWTMDEQFGHFPRQANGPGAYNEAGDFELRPLATGRRLTVAPESDAQRMTIEVNQGGALQLLDGRGVHSNGWYVVRSTVESGATENAINWLITPHAIPSWKSAPVIQVSQVGYHTKQQKWAFVELDKNDSARNPIELIQISDTGDHSTIISAAGEEWGRFLRYNYLRLDFTHVEEPGLYIVRYGEQETHPFQIAPTVFDFDVWQPAVDYYLPVQMCHMRVNDRYRVWHDFCHLDDARMAPINHNHFDGYISGASTLSVFEPGEHVPGLNVGGWHDAGDYDLRVESQAGTVHRLALAYEEFGIDYDNTTVNQSTRVVEIHRPDGKDDFLQQIEHGVLSIVGGYNSLGRLYRGIITPTLRQYVLLGEAANQTDNQIYHSTTVDEHTPEIGLPGSPDDRWVFTEENPGREFYSAAGLAAAARVLQGYNDALADQCLQVAVAIWNSSDRSKVAQAALLAVELYLTTGEQEYADFLIEQREDLFSDGGRQRTNHWMIARVVGKIGSPELTASTQAVFEKYAEEIREQSQATPYGVPYEPHIWGAGWGIQSFGVSQYFLNKHYPDLFDAATMHHALNFVLGCHPGPNTVSFASGVGANSLEVAYGTNRADWSFIPGGVGSGTALIRPDFPELLEWPFLWQQTEYVMGGGTTNYLFLVLAARHTLGAVASSE